MSCLTWPPVYYLPLLVCAFARLVNISSNFLFLKSLAFTIQVVENITVRDASDLASYLVGLCIWPDLASQDPVWMRLDLNILDLMHF